MGQTRVLSVDMLADKVYCRYDEEISDRAKRGRREKIVNACLEINKLDYWFCIRIGYGKNKALQVIRKKRKPD